MTGDWSTILSQEKAKPYFKSVTEFVNQKRLETAVFPPSERVFSAFKHTPYDAVKVVIVGQDPYHGPNQANGLAFSVSQGVRIPPSLRNIYREIRSDTGETCADHGDLTQWADQGVLLLNTVLTVEAEKPNSHKNLGWELFTDKVIEIVNQAPQHIVFLLWGAHAQKKCAMIDNLRHTVLTAPHPSPLSAHRGFLGCQHFSQTNEALKAHHQSPIEWGIKG